MRRQYELELVKELEDMGENHAADVRRSQAEVETVLEENLKIQEEAFKITLIKQEEEYLAAQVVELLQRKEEDARSMGQFKEEFDRQMAAVCDDHKSQAEFQSKRYEEEKDALLSLRDNKEHSRDIEVEEAMETLKSHLRSQHEDLLMEGIHTENASHEVIVIIAGVMVMIIIAVMAVFNGMS